MKKIFTAALLIVLGMATGITACHGQVPPASTGYNVDLSWIPPVPTGNWVGCTASLTCSYAVYAETIASGASCDPTTSANYKEITNPASRPTGDTYVDTNATGLTRCYDVETVQSGANSGPSNVATIAVPGVPLAPSLAPPATVTTDLVKPALPFDGPSPTLAKRPAPTGLMAMATKH